jgi:hypothetical protein
MEHWNLLKSFLEGEWKKKEYNGGDEPNKDTKYAYEEISQQNPMYCYHILIKML